MSALLYQTCYFNSFISFSLNYNFCKALNRPHLKIQIIKSIEGRKANKTSISIILPRNLYKYLNNYVLITMTNITCCKTQELNEGCSFLNDKSIIYIKCFLQTLNSVFCHKPNISAKFLSNVVNNHWSLTPA